MRIFSLARISATLALVLLSATAPAQTPQGTAFTYQGELRQNSAAVTASVDMIFDLFDAPTGGSAVGPSLSFTAGNGNPVQVQNGIFTVALDFGALAFNMLVSDERYLRVTINGNALAPRTKIENAPYALQSRTSELAYSVSNASVGSAQIVASQVQQRVSGTCTVGSSIQSIAQNGTVTCQTNGSGTVTSVGAGAGLTGGPITGSGTLAIANGGVGLAQIDSSAVQARITGTCTSAQKVLAVNANGTLTCGSDATGTGTVTNIASGTGLTGGPISSSGTLSIANGGVGLAQINTNEVQVHITGVCALGEYVRGLNADGSLICGIVPGTFARITSIANAAALGTRIGIAVGTDGLPVLSYAYGQKLQVVHCTDPACTASVITGVADTDLINAGQWSAIAIGSDGKPVVVFYDTSAQVLVVHCANVSCTAADSPAFVDSTTAGPHTSIAIGADGFPVLSYLSSTNNLKIVHCGNLNCTVTVATAFDTNGGSYDAIKIGADGLPIASYYDISNKHLKVAHCINPVCTAATSVAVDTQVDVGSYTSLAIGVDGLPIISYFDTTHADLKVAHCTDVACAGAPTITVVDTGSSVGQYTSIAIGADNLPIISYYDVTNGHLKVAHCGDAACTTAGSLSVDTAASVGQFTGIAIGSDGLPLVGYFDATNARLKVLKCNNRFCQ